jgi:hypothetical protein
MTAQTPTSKASGVSALLASFSNVPPPPQPPAKEDFLAVILQALTAQSGVADSPSPGPPAKEAEKPSSTDAAAPDPTAASLPPAWLAPAFASLFQSPALKASALSFHSAPPSQTAAEANSAKEKPSSTDAAAPDLTAASLLLALLAPPLPNLPQLLARKVSAPSVAFAPAVPPGLPATAQTAAEAKPAATAAAEKSPLAPVLTPPPNAPESKSMPPFGTSVANTNQRMSFVPERNEIAGRMEQKLPPAAISAVGSADTGGPSPDGGAKSSLAFSWHDAPSETLTITDLSTQAGTQVAPVAEATVDAPMSAASAAPVERLERMISREVLTIRQTGAQTLGVLLKLDSDTQLFLQLTSHNGSVQASVRCERGNFAPEDAQWAQLQQSLARQNVALLPMTGGANLNFQQPAEKHPRQPAAEREDWGAAGSAVQPAQPRKQKEQNRSPRNWESWA